MDGLRHIKVFFSFPKEGVLRGDGLDKGDEKKGDKNRFGYRSSYFDQLVCKIKEGQKKFLIFFLQKTSVSEGPLEMEKGKRGDLFAASKREKVGPFLLEFP